MEIVFIGGVDAALVDFYGLIVGDSVNVCVVACCGAGEKVLGGCAEVETEQNQQSQNRSVSD